MEEKRDSKNVFVIAHTGSIKRLRTWLNDRQFNFFNHYEDKRQQKFIGLQFVTSASQRERRGVILMKNGALLPEVERVLNEIIYGIPQEKR